ncbi:MAG: ribbon-helix-helix domain-containing protein [Hyphomicrobiales bacterium]|nr:ribbon-helix-helix domain-containing protein [Hyphomicrobiales bacterium]
MSAPERLNKLKAAMQGMSAPPPASPSVVEMPGRAPGPLRSSPLPPSRQGKKNVSAYINPEAAKQLRLLAVERDTHTQTLLEEALNDLFRKYNKSAVV